MEILIISGLSGGGKSKAASFLEDMGFYIVDNMPAAMILKFAEFCAGGGGRYDRVALVYDVRTATSFTELFDVLDQLKTMECECRMLFLEASPEALTAIRDADVLLLGPGSLYTSIIPNLLVDGIVQAIQASHALKIYVCNVMTQEGETEGYTVSDHIQALFQHAAPGLFQVCLANSSPIPREVAARYASEGAEPLQCDVRTCAALGVEVVRRPMAVVEDGYVRHHPDALARELILLHAERSVRIAGSGARDRADAYRMEHQK